MTEVMVYERINEMTIEQKKINIADKYKYFQSYHNCLYCYETLEEITGKDEVCILDENGTFKVFREKQLDE